MSMVPEFLRFRDFLEPSDFCPPPFAFPSPDTPVESPVGLLWKFAFLKKSSFKTTQVQNDQVLYQFVRIWRLIYQKFSTFRENVKITLFSWLLERSLGFSLRWTGSGPFYSRWVNHPSPWLSSSFGPFASGGTFWKSKRNISNRRSCLLMFYHELKYYCRLCIEKLKMAYELRPL